MTTPAEAAADLYAQLKPEAVTQAREYVMSHTPADIQEEMLTIIELDLARVDLPEGQVIVSHGETCYVLTHAAPHNNVTPGTLVIANGRLDGTALSSENHALCMQGSGYPLEMAGVAQPGSPVYPMVAGNLVTHIEYTLPATHAFVNEGQAVVVNDTAGVPNAGSPGVAKVASGLLASVDIN